MVVWFSKEMTCPMCRSRLCGREVGGGFALEQDSDLLVHMEGKHVIQAEIHTCQTCRYSGYLKDFHINTTPDVGERFLRDVTPRLTGAPKNSISSTPLPDIQYVWAYESAKFLGRPSLALGNLLLRAYWCLRLPPVTHLTEAESEKRKKTYLSKALDHYHQSLRGNRNPHLYYLMGELSRRNGDHESAITYFQKYLTRRNTVEYLRIAATKLSALAREGHSKELSMKELFSDHKTNRPQQ